MSIAGSNSDQTLAAIITPAAKPSITLRKVREIVRVKNTGDAPIAVTPQVNPPASNTCQTGASPFKPVDHRPTIPIETIRRIVFQHCPDSQ